MTLQEARKVRIGHVLWHSNNDELVRVVDPYVSTRHPELSMLVKSATFNEEYPWAAYIRYLSYPYSPLVALPRGL